MQRRYSKFRDQRPRPCFAAFDTAAEVPSVANLSRTLSINGQVVEPTFWYKGQDADSGTGQWASEYGGAAATLSESGAGLSPSYDQGVPLHGADLAVQYNNAKHHLSSGNVANVPDGQPFRIEALVRVTANTDYILAKGNYTTEPNYVFYVTSAGVLVLSVGQSGTAVTVSYSSLTAGAWYYASMYCNPQDNSVNGMRIYVNASNGTQSNPYGYLTSNTGKLSIGAAVTGSTSLSGAVGFVSLHTSVGMIASGAAGETELRTIHLQRFRALVGARPQINAYGRDAAPITQARNTCATLEKYNTTTSAVEYYTVGENWPRIERWLTASGDVVDGYRSEEARQNECLQSNTLGTTWTEVAQATSDNSYPGVGLNLDGVVTADAVTDTQHGWQQAITLTAASWVISGKARKGAQNWLYVADDTVANCWAYFDLDNGVVGNRGAGCAASSIASKGDHYAWEMTFTGTVAAHTISIYASDADDNAADPAYVGDGASVDVHVGQINVELGTTASSWIETFAAAVTRNKDELEYTLVGSGAHGCLAFDVVVKNGAQVAVASVPVDLSDAGATNRIYAYIGTNERVVAYARDGAVVGTTDVNTGNAIKYCVNWNATLAESWVNGALDDATPPSHAAIAAVNQIAIGMAFNNANQPSAPMLIKAVRFFQRYRHDAQRVTK